MRHRPPGQPGQEPLALGGRADHVVQPLEEQERHGDPVGVLDRRPLRVPGGHLREGPDETVRVARLEVVGPARRPAHQVQHGVADRAAGVDVGAGQRDGGGPAARAAAPDGQPPAVGGALVGERQGDGRAVLHVDHAPLLAQPLPVLPPVPGGAAVVDLGDPDAPGGEVGDLQIQYERGAIGGPAVRPHDVGRQFVAGRDLSGVVGRVDVRVDVTTVGAGERTDPGLGVVGRVHRVVVRGSDHPGPAGPGVQLHHLVRAARAGRDADDAFPLHREGGRELRPRSGRVDELLGLRVEDPEHGGPAAVHDRDEPALQRREPALPELPQGSAELLLAGADGLVVAVQVPPAATVACIQ